MLAARKEEKQLAIKNEQYHQGILAITVIVDGGWCKLAHKHTYLAWVLSLGKKQKSSYI